MNRFKMIFCMLAIGLASLLNVQFLYPEDTQQFLDESQKFAIAKDFKSAIGTLEAGLKKFPKDKDLNMMRATYYLELNNLRAAYQIFNDLLRQRGVKDSYKSHIYKIFAGSYIANGNYLNAIKYLQKSLKIDKVYPGSRMEQMAECYRKLGEMNNVFRVLYQLRDLDYAYIAGNAEFNRTVQGFLDTLLEKSPEDPKIWCEKACWWECSGDDTGKENSLTCVEQALKLNPDYDYALYLKGIILSAKDPEKSRVSFEKSLKAKPGRAKAHIKLAGVLVKKLKNKKQSVTKSGDALFQQAESSLLKARELDPEDPELWRVFSVLKDLEGKGQESEEMKKKSEELSEKNPVKDWKFWEKFVF